ncbi:helix-turn-helix domain-containing protein [Rhodococcus indonesiensis]
MTTPSKLAVPLSEAAAMLSVNPRTLRRYIAAGKVPAFRLPGGRDLRIPVAALEALVNGNAGGASA